MGVQENRIWSWYCVLCLLLKHLLAGEAGGKLVASLTEPEATQLEAREGGGWLIGLLLPLQDGGVVVVEVEAAEYEAPGHLHDD